MGIKEEYATEQENMEPSEFKKFLTEQLIKNIGLNKESAAQEAKTMIEGKKEVQEGNYAILELKDAADKNIYYYTRNKKKWVRDKTITEGLIIDKNKLLCNIKENCFQAEDECKDMTQFTDMLNINKILNEYTDEGNLD